MDLNFAPEDEAFRLEIRQWIEENLKRLPNRSGPSSHVRAIQTGIERKAWYKALAEKGWLCLSWPEKCGGTGWSMIRQVIFRDEAAALGAPGVDMGVFMVGPLIIEYGTDEQRRRYLPKIAAGEEMWCQGYSEPNAGSDLANLALKAERDGDDYVLNGQKIWTSSADESEMIFLLARTNSQTEKKQQGISFLVAPMDTPGIEIRPIRQITGEAHFFETFFTDVRVPVANRIGPENDGWAIAKRLLAHERVHLGGAIMFRQALESVTKLARETEIGGAPAIEDPAVRDRLARLHMDMHALNQTDNRTLTSFLQGKMPGPESSITKLFGSEMFQRITDLSLDILGPAAQFWDDENGAAVEQGWPKTAVGSRAYSIFSGTSEVQRNIISERVLGMPRS